MCNHMFETLEEFCGRYRLDTEKLLRELTAASFSGPVTERTKI